MSFHHPLHLHHCCGPFSVSLLAGVSFQSVHDYFIEFEKRTKIWKGRSLLSELKRALKHFEVTTFPMEGYKGYSLKKALSELDNNQYLVHITGHFMTYQSGQLFDQYYPDGIDWNQYIKIHNKRVKSIIRIEKIGN